MTSYRVPASAHGVPGEVLQELVAVMAARQEPWLLIGAAARDLTILSRVSGLRAVRATRDVDVAVACRSLADFKTLGDALPRSSGVHTFEVAGVEVDVVPFGGVERDGLVRFDDGSELDTVGLDEAVSDPHDVTVEVPGGALVRLPVVAPHSQAVLKILAWRDRSLSKGPHDAVDLHAILEASSMGPYEQDVWGDSEALDATESDIICAGPYRFGRLAAQTFSPERPERAMAVTALLADAAVTRRLATDMGGRLAPDRLDAFGRGFMSRWPGAGL